MSPLDELVTVGQTLQRLAKLSAEEILQEVGGSEDALVQALGMLEHGSRVVRERVRVPRGQTTVGTSVLPGPIQVSTSEGSSTMSPPDPEV